MNDPMTKAVRLIKRLRDRNTQAHEAIIAQARVIAELDCARSDLVDMANHPLNFLRALLAEAQEAIASDVTMSVQIHKGEMRMGFLVPGRPFSAFDITSEDYAKGFDMFLSEVKAHMEKR